MTTDQELKVINDAAINEKLGLFGTFEMTQLAAILGISFSEIMPLCTYGLVDVSILPVSGVTNATNKFYTFTNRWRLLRKLETYDALIKWENNEQLKEEKRKENSDLFIQYQAENAEWQSRLNPLIELANKSTITTNENIVITNTNIRDSNTTLRKIFLWTAIFAFFGIFIGGITLCRDVHKDKLQEQLISKDSTIKVEKIEILQMKTSEILRMKTMDSIKCILDSLQKNKP